MKRYVGLSLTKIGMGFCPTRECTIGFKTTHLMESSILKSILKSNSGAILEREIMATFILFRLMPGWPLSLSSEHWTNLLTSIKRFVKSWNIHLYSADSCHSKRLTNFIASILITEMMRIRWNKSKLIMMFTLQLGRSRQGIGLFSAILLLERYI